MLNFMVAMHLGAIDPGQIVFGAHIDSTPNVEKLAKTQPLPKDNYLEAPYRNKPFRDYRLTYILPSRQIALTPKPDGTHEGALEFVAVVTDDQGRLVNSITSDLKMDLKPDTYAQVVARGINLPVTLAIPEKGAYFVRVGIHDRTSGKSGALELSADDIDKSAAKP